MVTERSYVEDPYAKEGTGKAVKVEFTDLVVDRTVFVPTGDGQPNDRGDVIIDGKKYVIVDAWNDGESIHLMSLDTYPTDIIGKEVKQLIDWNVRYLHMRFRTALYIMQGIAYKDYSANCRINQTYDDSAWIDVYLDNLTEDTVNEILAKARSIVEASLDISSRFTSREEFQASAELMAFTKGKVPDFE
ncbi:Alanyl tRNA synthetase second additional domain protein, partial [mine drainage metagenome]